MWYTGLHMWCKENTHDDIISWEIAKFIGWKGVTKANKIWNMCQMRWQRLDKHDTRLLCHLTKFQLHSYGLYYSLLPKLTNNHLSKTEHFVLQSFPSYSVLIPIFPSFCWFQFATRNCCAVIEPFNPYLPITSRITDPRGIRTLLIRPSCDSSMAWKASTKQVCGQRVGDPWWFTSRLGKVLLGEAGLRFGKQKQRSGNKIIKILFKATLYWLEISRNMSYVKNCEKQIKFKFSFEW